MDDGSFVGRIDPQRGVRLAGRRAADQQRSLQAQPLHLPGHGQAELDRSQGMVAPRDQSDVRITAALGSLLVRGFSIIVERANTPPNCLVGWRLHKPAILTASFPNDMP